MKTPFCFKNEESKDVIASVCAANGIDKQLLQELCEIQAEHSGAERAAGSYQSISAAIDKFLERHEEG